MVMTVNFCKYHGTGNDFILIDNREGLIVLDSRHTVARWCHRRFGIGADGVILLEKSTKADFRMRYYNSDGRESSFCGNGGRCVAAFAASLGIVSNKTIFEASDGMHQAEINTTSNGELLVSLKMADVQTIDKKGDAFVMNTGSPHYVIISNEPMDDIDVVNEGREIRNSEPYRKEGINVNFVSCHNGQFFLRTYERGVEDETWSCGTGTVAAALAIEKAGKTTHGSPLSLQTPGGTLVVSFNHSGKGFTEIYLTGNAVKVYDGQIKLT